MTTPTWLEMISGFTSSLRLEDVPERVVAQAKLCLIDTIGCIVSGNGSDGARRLLQVETGASPSGQATVLGMGVRLPVDAAARVNAYMGDVFELNDLIAGHASIGNVSAMMAQAEFTGCSGRDMLLGQIAGTEATAAIYHALWEGTRKSYAKPYTEVGINSVGIITTMGIAAGLSRVAGYTSQTTANAMAISGMLAGWCPAEGVFGDGGTAKLLLFGGWPSTVAFKGVRYADAGLTGPRRLLESDIGYYRTVAFPGHPDPQIGKVWHMENPRRKWHACCGFFHSGLDMLVEMRKNGVRFDRAEKIVVSVMPNILTTMVPAGPPRTPEETVFHSIYNFAVAAVSEDVIGPEHSLECASYLADSRVRRLMEAIEIVPNPELTHSMHCEVTVYDGAGDVLASKRILAPKGAPDNRMTDDEVKEKFFRLTHKKISRSGAEAFVRRVETIEDEAECSWLAKSFG